jgi:hypothetical protein
MRRGDEHEFRFDACTGQNLDHDAEAEHDMSTSEHPGTVAAAVMRKASAICGSRPAAQYIRYGLTAIQPAARGGNQERLKVLSARHGCILANGHLPF